VTQFIYCSNFSVLLATAIAISSGPHATAAQDYPDRQLSIVVPYAPGGGTDILARVVAQKLSDRLGKPVIIENRPGAGTVVAARSVAKASPDGHTLMVGTSSTLSINVTLYKKLPYDPATELVPVALLSSLPFVLVANPSLRVSTVADLIALAKEKPGQLNYGSGGPGAANHLFFELLKSMTDTNLTHVAYKGSSPALNDVVAGHIQFAMAELAAALPLIRSGKVQALGVTTSQPLAGAPEIPPIASDVPGYDAAAWQMLIAPAATPKDVVKKLNLEVNAIITAEEVSRRLSELGQVALGKGSPEELSAFVTSETVRWGKIVQQAGIEGSE
jgi:tripartite-type tricarboxylate transporter receptor subunit TctC